jgi:DNA gyrase subunit A
MGRAASGVKGIKLIGDDRVVGMVVADPAADLLTVCANGYGKRTPFGPNAPPEAEGPPQAEAELEGDEPEPPEAELEAESDEGAEGEGEHSSQRSYRTQRRGGKGLRDIKTSARNGPAVGVVRVGDDDELLMITARGKLQRIPAADVSQVGRNTQGVRIMNVDEGDTLVAVKRVPKEEAADRTEGAQG